jgi:hypothetical protein
MKEFLSQTLPNWIMALAALWAVIEIIRGYIKLKQQQKESEEKMNYFNEQLNEFRKQTTQFEYQTTIMSENNKILDKGIENLLKILSRSQEAEEQVLEIERLRRISEIRPFFVFKRGQSNPREFSISITNNGGTATKPMIISISTKSFSVSSIMKDIAIEKGQDLRIIGTPSAGSNANLISGQILLGYTDVEGNHYQQNITKDSNSYKIGLPIKIDH